MGFFNLIKEFRPLILENMPEPAEEHKPSEVCQTDICAVN